MSKENEPTSLADLAAGGTRGALDEKAKVSAFCHTCRRELYFSRENNFVTQTVAKGAARSHGDSYNHPPHHVSVFSGEFPTLLEETLAVNENSKSKSRPFPRKHFFIPIK